MSEVGHLRRMDGAGAVSGLTPIATVLLWSATYARGYQTWSVAPTVLGQAGLRHGMSTDTRSS
jgi:hypothetical protein